MSSANRSLPFTSVKDQKPISATAPKGWKAVEIIYLHVSPAMSADGLTFELMRNSGMTPLDGTTTYDKFLKQVVAGQVPNLGPLHDHRKKKPGPLDFRLEKDAHVVIELDRRANWEFRNDWDGLSTSGDTSLYGCLVHIDRHGKHHPAQGIEPTSANPNTPPRRPTCNIVAFAARARADEQPYPSDPLNIYAQLDPPDSGAMFIILDPDVENPGGPPHLGG